MGRCQPCSVHKTCDLRENGANRLFAPYAFAFTSHPAPERFTCDEADYRSGILRYKTGAGLLPCIAAEIPTEHRGGNFSRRHRLRLCFRKRRRSAF